MEQLCITVRAHDDPRSYEQVLSLIADRYGNGLYEQVHVGQPADVDVRVSRPGLDPICILDAFRHQALRWKLIAELGKFDQSGRYIFAVADVPNSSLSGEFAYGVDAGGVLSSTLDHSGVVSKSFAVTDEP